MRDGTWIDDAAVRTLTARAFVADGEVDVDGYRLVSEMTASLPITEGAGSPVTTGSVDWTQQELVQSSSPQPFVRSGAWPPRQGQSFTLEVGDGDGQWWRQVTGYVDVTTGRLTSGSVSSDVVDLVDRLSRKITRDAMLSTYPPGPAFPDGSTVDEYRMIRLVGIYVTDFCARAAGFYATPPKSSDTILSVPVMGSTWPEVGTVIESGLNGDLSIPPRFGVSPWGCAMYQPYVWWTFLNRPSFAEVTVNLGPTGGTRLDIVRQETGVGLYLDQPDGTKTVNVGVYTAAGEDSGTVLTLDATGCTRVALAYNVRTADQVIDLTLRADNDTEVSWTSPAAAVWSSTDAYPGSANVYGGGSIGAIIVDHLFKSWRALYAPVTAIIKPGRFTDLSAMPALKGEQSALDLLVAQASAEGASVWLDSDGRLHWIGRGVLEAGPSVALISTDLTLDDLSWTDDLSGARELITVKRRAPAIQRATDYRVTLAQPNVQNLSKGQSIETRIEPDADEDWVMVDQVGTRLNTGALTSAAVLRENTWFGGVITYDDDNPIPAWSVAAEVSITVDWIASDTGVYTIDVINPRPPGSDHPAGSYFVNQIKDNQPTSLIPKWLAGTGLPLVRGKAKIVWSDDTKEYDTGISAPTVSYEHDCSWFVQQPDDLADVASWLVSITSNPQPRVASVSVAYDPRLELGDKVTLTDPARTGLEIDLVITRIEQSQGGDSPTMTLSGRVTRAGKPYDITDPTSGWDDLLTGWRGANA